MTPQTDLNERERLLLMAALLYGTQPNAEIRANCGRVLRQALAWAGLWNDQLEHDYRNCTENPIIEEWYDTMIEMASNPRNSTSLIDVQGNLGSPVDPRAYPRFTGCRLTSTGRELAQTLLAEQPEYRP